MMAVAGLVTVVAVLLAISGTSQAFLSGRIYGGEEAAIGDFPFVVSLRADSAHVCGGSILDEYHILTAAHCVVDRNDNPILPNRLTARVGSINQFAGGKIVYVARNNVHKQFDYYHYDLAVLKLTEPLQFNDKVAPIALANAGEQAATGASVTVAGWGAQSSDSAAYKLNTATYKVASPSFCKDSFVHYKEDTICLAHELQTGICHGDGGNGLIYNGKLIGVANYIIGACGSRYPDVSINIVPYVEWINSILNA